MPLIITATQPTLRRNRCPIRYACVIIQETCQLPSPSVSSLEAQQQQLPDVPCTPTAMTLPAPDSHSSLYEPPTTAIAHAYMKLPAVLVPLEQSLPLLRLIFVANDPPGIVEDLRWGAIDSGIRRGRERRKVSTNP